MKKIISVLTILCSVSSHASDPYNYYNECLLRLFPGEYTTNTDDAYVNDKIRLFTSLPEAEEKAPNNIFHSKIWACGPELGRGGLNCDDEYLIDRTFKLKGRNLFFDGKSCGRVSHRLIKKDLLLALTDYLGRSLLENIEIKRAELTPTGFHVLLFEINEYYDDGNGHSFFYYPQVLGRLKPKYSIKHHSDYDLDVDR